MDEPCGGKLGILIHWILTSMYVTRETFTPPLCPLPLSRVLLLSINEISLLRNYFLDFVIILVLLCPLSPRGCLTHHGTEFPYSILLFNFCN